MSESQASIHALSGAYAVDALEDLDRLRFEHHLRECTECQEEVTSLREGAAALAATEQAMPSAELRASVLAGIRNVRPLPPERDRASDRPTADHHREPAPAPRHAAQRSARRRWPRLLAAAAAVAAIGTGGVVAWQQLADQPGQEVVLTATERVLEAPDAEEETISFDGGAATLVRSESEGRAVIVTTAMPEPDEGSVYQLWLASPDGEFASAGLVPEPGETVLLRGDASAAVGAGITVEPDGGSPEPRGDTIALFDFDSLEPRA
jgi:anti-sigma-K factor RskA